jgi:threonyl-tRNA synthetase
LKTSGHYDYYKENMYILTTDEVEYAIKPMNCPAHILIYKDKIRSYRDLPLRLFELGDVLRNEKSGVLHGLLRVRGFTQDDAHIFCLKEQLVEEISGVIDFVFEVLEIFGFNEYEVELSTQPEKFIGSKKSWREATTALENSLKNKNIRYTVHKGEGAFYGPKIDIKLKDALGRFWQCATIQCDFALPDRFDLTYIGPDGKEHRPIMLHRVILGSLERFIGALIEHYAGALPLWLSPVQVSIIPISENHRAYAEKIKKILEENSIRAEVDLRNEKMQYKIREAQTLKIPYMLIVGDKEVDTNTVAVRMRSGGDQGAVSIDDFVKKVTREVAGKQ